jgi:hypothetical protein
MATAVQLVGWTMHHQLVPALEQLAREQLESLFCFVSIPATAKLAKRVLERLPCRAS